MAELAAERRLTVICQLILFSSLLLWETWERLAHRPQTLSRPLVIKSAVCLAKKKKLHSCFSVCLWHCNDSMQFFCTTPSCSRTIRTNSQRSFVFIAFNPYWHILGLTFHLASWAWVPMVGARQPYIGLLQNVSWISLRLTMLLLNSISPMRLITYSVETCFKRSSTEYHSYMLSLVQPTQCRQLRCRERNQPQLQVMTISTWNFWSTWVPEPSSGCHFNSPESCLHTVFQKSEERPKSLLLKNLAKIQNVRPVIARSLC